MALAFVQVRINIYEYLRVGREANAGNLSNLSKEFADSLLVNIEGQVTDEEGIALRANNITVFLGTVVGTSLRVSISRLGVGVVKVEGTTIEFLTLHGLVGLGGRLVVFKVNVSEATAATAHPVGDNTSANETAEVLESLLEGIVVDVPAQAAGKQSSGSGNIVLCLLGSGVDVVLGLALLGRSLSLGLFLGIRVRRVGVIRVVLRVITGVGVLEHPS